MSKKIQKLQLEISELKLSRDAVIANLKNEPENVTLQKKYLIMSLDIARFEERLQDLMDREV